jgi:hypothetical protein
MLNIVKILFPVDFSERCIAIVPYVRVIAQQYKAEVILLHVVNPVYVIPAAGIAAPAVMPVPQWVFTERRTSLRNLSPLNFGTFPCADLYKRAIQKCKLSLLPRQRGWSSWSYRRMAMVYCGAI